MSLQECVLTGGSCSGKTTALNYLQEKLMDRGSRVFVVPEVPTLFITGGLHDIGEIASQDPKKFIEIEKQILLMGRSFRERFVELAGLFPRDNRIILYDRGPMDVEAYLPADNAKELMRSILDEVHLTLSDARDSFDGIFHLVTAAEGAEKFYTTENNKARQETPEEARALDKRTQSAWVGHPHLRIIDNSTDFEGKMKRLLKAVSRVLGIPVPLEIERKFLLRSFSPENLAGLSRVQVIRIEQVYLKSLGDDEIRIRKRTQDGHSIYYRTVKRRVSYGVRHETEKRITTADYLSLMKFKDPKCRIIHKDRHCFVYDNQYFELDGFLGVDGLVVLEIELTEENDKVCLPPFLDVLREVTGDLNYTNHEIAKRGSA